MGSMSLPFARGVTKRVKFQHGPPSHSYFCSRDLSLADFPGYEPVGDRKDYPAGVPISERKLNASIRTIEWRLSRDLDFRALCLSGSSSYFTFCGAQAFL